MSLEDAWLNKVDPGDHLLVAEHLESGLVYSYLYRPVSSWQHACYSVADVAIILALLLRYVEVKRLVGIVVFTLELDLLVFLQKPCVNQLERHSDLAIIHQTLHVRNLKLVVAYDSL